MNEIKRYFPLIGSLIISLIFPFFADGHVNISGKVIDSTSAIPIESIKVLLLSSSPQEAITDAKGLYQFLNVPSGQYTVQVELPANYVAVSANPITVSVENSSIKVNFSLGISGNIVGHVLDSTTNLPIANANVDVMRGNNIIVSVMTDENGNYSVSSLAPRPYIIRVRMPYFQSSLQLGIPVSGQTITVDFALQCPPGKLEGQVINTVTRQPISNATIDLFEDDLIIDSVQINEDGTYAVSEIAPGSYKIRASAANYEVRFQSINLLTNQLLPTNFALEPFGTVTGQVIHAFTGQPIARASVGMWQNDVLFSATHTDENGYFSLDGLWNNQLVVQFLNFYGVEKEVKILPSQTTTQNFILVFVEPVPPRKVSVKVVYKRFAHQVNRIHVVKWKASVDPSAVAYRLYRDEKLITEVSANDPLTFNDEWRSDNIKIYEVTAINIFGQESLPVSVKVK